VPSEILMQMSQENIDVVRHMLDAFNRGDVPAVLAAFDRNCELDEPPECLTGALGASVGTMASASGWPICARWPG
jgi:hypothetical protein